ncbi:hypothetical protein SLEP1_g10196 [Rubroshorea leprosula]|uniref:RING-type E3 ubiquitin transferase n=1 Tax=Rubroshorea leprosula TaxID=152421 RepID=A0AAV5IIL6_9ROSI|nr:hypothetical protein SLEP1_g10196 [Rubroshorea leprosula]
MECQEAVMKLVVHNTAPEKATSGVGREKEKGTVSGRHKWSISLYKSSSNGLKHQQEQIPKEFCCPLSGSLMAEPVIVSSGHSYERACVQACKTLGFIPTLVDGAILDFFTVIPNLALKSSILNWCNKHSVDPPKPLDVSSAEILVLKLMESENKMLNTHNEKEVQTVSYSEKELIQGVKDNPSIRFTHHAVTELTRRSTHFDSPLNESEGTTFLTPPLQLATLPSCYSSASSSEIQTFNPNPSSSEEEEGLVTKMRSTEVFEVKEAVILLRKTTRNREDSRAKLCTPDLLSALQSLIISGYTNIQVNAVAALVNLSLEKVNKVKIVRSGMVPPLIDVLKGGSPEAQEHAAGALFSLAIDDGNKTAIGVLGALPPLMHMMRSENQRTRHDSAMALYHLSLVQSNRIKLVKIGSVPVLLSMVKSGHMLGRVLQILCNLATCEAGRTAVLDSGGVECLVGMLRGTELNEPTQESCVAALYGLSYGGLRFKGLAKAAGVVEALCKVGGRAKVKARRILEMLKVIIEEEEEDVDWEELLESGSTSQTRVRLGGGKAGSGVNSTKF